jgi:hypothetical protein
MNNIQISKYSKKCLNIIKDNIYFNLKEFDNKLLDKLGEIYNSTNPNNEYKIIYENLLKKLHTEKEYPLLYMHYLEINKNLDDSKNKIMSLNNFYNYYTENNDKIPDLLEKKTAIIDLINNPNKDRKKLNSNIYNNHFVTMDIQQISEVNDLIYREISQDNDKIYLYETEDKRVNLDLIMFILKFMKNLAKSYGIKHNPIELVLLMSPQKKLKTNIKFLGPENINSGSTYANHKVFIWRYEEVYKVLIHELIHFFMFDQGIFMKSLISNSINKHCIIGEDRENESYTESFALIIHTYLLSKFLKKSFFELINYEINFSIYQCKKIMNFYKIKNIADIIYKTSCNNPIKQKTAVFSYFFIKTSLMINLNNTMNFIYENNHEKFNDMIKKSINNENFIKLINKSLYYFGNNDFVENTLRMTCLEFF